MRNNLRLIALTWVIFVCGLILQNSDSLRLSQAQEIAKSHLYSTIQWELDNFFDKWIHKIKTFATSSSLTPKEQTDLISQYFSLVDREALLRNQISATNNNTDPLKDKSLTKLRSELSNISTKRLEIRDQVEEILEAAIQDAVDKEGLIWGAPLRALGIKMPPVDFRLEPAPMVLVVSPRERIEMIEGFLLRPGITLSDIEEIENMATEVKDLSILAEQTGGVATYPSIVPPDRTLNSTLITATHEWLHHYLFFHPLGRNYWGDHDTRSLNETLANIFGQELGSMLSKKYTQTNDRISFPSKHPTIDFRSEMQIVRKETDRLLADGNIIEAELYMEQKRQFLEAHGFNIRRINQAYFAFHGTYADSSASVSPIFDQLTSLRASSHSLGDFVHKVAKCSNYENFQKMLSLPTGTAC